MLSDDMMTSPLVDPSERPAVVIEPLRRPSRLRTWHVAWELLRLVATLLWLRVTLRLTPAEHARRLSAFLQRMGTIWVKAGQVMGMRSDLLPAEFATELVHLRDRGPGFPFSEARRIVEEELQAPLEHHFDEFEPRPFAAATGFQLHRAICGASRPG